MPARRRIYGFVAELGALRRRISRPWVCEYCGDRRWDRPRIWTLTNVATGDVTPARVCVPCASDLWLTA